MKIQKISEMTSEYGKNRQSGLGTALPALEDVRKMTAGTDCHRVPVYRELPADMVTPIMVLRKLKNVSEHCFILESAEAQERWGRYTFLGYDPTLEIRCRAGKMKIGSITVETKDPASYIRQIMKEHKAVRIPELPPFAGGLVGYFSYDYLKYAEPTLSLDAEDTEEFEDIDLMLFENVIVFDNVKQKIILISNMNVDEGEAGYHRAERNLAEMRDLILYGKPAEDVPGKLTSDMTPYFDKEAYCEMIRKAKDHIHEGDIFQIVLSNRLEGSFEGTLLNTYRVLRTVNPSPYMFYLSGTDVETAGASPETLVRLEDGVLHTFPLAGTRRRGKTPEEDRALEEELLADEKELAEHNMLVDLGRNDLGRLSEFGSVEVEHYHQILRFSHVMHIGSTVRGTIRDGLDALDTIGAVLPAGTLSGAPKIRACQLINELEDNRRGIYGGAIGYIDFTGNMDTCIGIRLAYKKNGKVFVRSGAGIVADSVPEKEYEECINKAAAVVRALEEADGYDFADR